MANIVKTKLRAVGNSTGLVLRKEVLTDMFLSWDDEVFLVKTDDSYKITVYDAQFEAQMEAAQKGMRQYRNALKELAK